MTGDVWRQVQRNTFKRSLGEIFWKGFRCCSLDSKHISRTVERKAIKISLHSTVCSPSVMTLFLSSCEWRVNERHWAAEQRGEGCIIRNSAAGRAVVKILIYCWKSSCSCHHSETFSPCIPLPPLSTSARVHANVCGLFLFVRLSCVRLYCRTVMENVLGLLPHLVPKEIWLNWTPLLLIGWGQLHRRHRHTQKNIHTESTDTDMQCVLFFACCSR